MIAKTVLWLHQVDLFTNILMKPALRFKPQASPTMWQEFPLGEHMRQAIEGRLQLWWPKFFGYHLLKIGNLSAAIDSSDCQINHQISVAETSDKAGVIAEIDDLPFKQHCVDVAILSHCLEFYPDPHHLLREADRVLIPDGHLVISGFNPLSLCGLTKLAKWHSNKLPWSGRFFSIARIRDWLNLLGFEVLEVKCMLFSSLLYSHGYRPLGWRQKLASRYFEHLGSIYVIVARKRELPLTPIKLKWRVKPAFNPATIKSALRQ